MNSKVRQTLDLLDAQFTQDNGLSYSSLETALAQAQNSDDIERETELTLDMATRFSTIATFASTLARGGQELPGMPSAADALEPAIQLYARGLVLATKGNDLNREKFARNRLGDCYVQSEQFDKALVLLEHTLSLCQMPDDAFIMFDTVQKIGDCHVQLENDAAALSAYERGLEIAKAIDDPFEVTVQLGKMASALSNLKRYDEALAHYADSRDRLVRISVEPALQQRVSVHKHQFSVEALPRVIAYTEQRMAHTRAALGRDLLRELPYRLASIASAALTGQRAPDLSDWRCSAN